MRKATGNRRPKPATHRDSDASYTSSRPSSSSVGVKRSAPGDYYNDRGYQHAAIRTINAFLKANGGPVDRLQSSLHSAKEISDTLLFLMKRLDYPSNKVDEDLPILLKMLNSPFSLTKSVLRAPGNPHYWPNFLVIIHWLVELIMFKDHTFSGSASGNWSVLRDNAMSSYALDCYSHYIDGDDDAVEELDKDFLQKLELERDAVVGNVEQLNREVEVLTRTLEELRTNPSPREVFQNQKALLEEDVRKFQKIISEFSGSIESVDRVLEAKTKELETKEQEEKKLREENENLKKMVASQAVNLRDAERMKKELQAVERDLREAESSRNAWEEKSWDVNTAIGHKLKELEGLQMECNQAIRRLKLEGNLEYALNAKGASPVEVMGIDYKGVLNPALGSLANVTKNNSMKKLDELITLQKQSIELANKIEGKRKRISILEKHNDEVQGELSLLKKTEEDHIARCEMEEQRVVQDFEIEAQSLDNFDKEVAATLKAANYDLQNVIEQSEEEIQKCAIELFVIVDSVSKYKELAASKISQARDELSKTAAAVSKAYKGSLSLQFESLFEKSN